MANIFNKPKLQPFVILNDIKRARLSGYIGYYSQKRKDTHLTEQPKDKSKSYILPFRMDLRYGV